MNLFSINGYELPKPLKGNLQLKTSNNYNEYETEDGNKKIESLKENIYSGSVNYKGLLEADLLNITSKITLVSTLVLYSPFTNTYHTISALIDGLNTSNIITEENVNAWSLSFNFEEVNRD